MIFEMTLDYSIVLPMTLTVAVSYGLRRLLFAESIYTLKLARRGHPMPWALQANAYRVHHVTDIVIDPVRVLDAAEPPARLAPKDAEEEDKRSVVLVADGKVAGVVSYAWMLGHREEIARAASLAELSRRDYVVVQSSTAIFEVLGRLRARRAVLAVVVRPPEDPAARDEPVLGLVTLAHLAEALAEGMEMFAD